MRPQRRRSAWSDLGERHDHFPSQMSGGEQQRGRDRARDRQAAGRAAVRRADRRAGHLHRRAGARGASNGQPRVGHDHGGDHAQRRDRERMADRVMTAGRRTDRRRRVENSETRLSSAQDLHAGSWPMSDPPQGRSAKTLAATCSTGPGTGDRAGDHAVGVAHVHRLLLHLRLAAASHATDLLRALPASPTCSPRSSARPNHLASAHRRDPGVTAVPRRASWPTSTLDVFGYGASPSTGRLISIEPEQDEPRSTASRCTARAASPSRDRTDEVLVSEGFALAHDLMDPGSTRYGP